MNALDTNIYIYAHDTRDVDKQRKAQAMIEITDPIALLWQVGCEFIAATRKLEPLGFTRKQAWQALMDMQAMAKTVVLPETDLWLTAHEVQEHENINFWDAMIVAACIHGGIEVLYSEDFARQERIRGVSVVNPFA